MLSFLVGSLYIADFDNDVIRKAKNSSGTYYLSTVMGGGSSSDGTSATSIQLNGPTGLLLDSGGNLYVTGFYNHVIKKLSAASNSFPTIAPTSSYQTPAPTSTPVLSVVAGTSGVEGTDGDWDDATSVELKDPTSIAFDTDGNLYIADYSRIRKVSASTGIITTVAGVYNTGITQGSDNSVATSAVFCSTYGIALDSSDNLYITDDVCHSVRKLTVSSDAISTIAGSNDADVYGIAYGDGGQATSARLCAPTGIALDSSGILFSQILIDISS